jgi:uncharacterized protein (TIGR02145 family)
MNRMATPAGIWTVVLIVLLLTSCDYYIKPPYPSYTTITGITALEATAKSRIIWDGGSDLKECGFCWNTTGYPSKADSYAIAELANEIFSSKIENLSGGTKYYIRSYAENKAGIFYGDVVNFITTAYKLPVVSTPWVSDVTHNSVATSGGGINYDNSYNVFSKGVCWSTSKNPTTADQKADLGSGFGGLGCNIEGLTPATVYYLRAYATNVVGTAYGETRVIRTFDGYTTDYEGHVYSTVRLGDQEWMNRNLETRYFSNGDMINTTGTATTNTEQEDKPVYQWAYQYHEDHPELLDSEGRLYTWYTATDSRKICPAGWRLPSIDEWNKLLTHLGGDTLTLRDIRWSFNYYWDSMLNAGATEGSFGVQLVGFRAANGQFQYGSNYGTFWWSATEASSGNGYSIYCGKSDFEKLIRTESNKKNGYSIRCVKDFTR